MENELGVIHKDISRASFLILMMLVKRRFRRQDAVESVEQLKSATIKLENLLGRARGEDQG
jgi:hypothetical protein